MKQHVVKKEDEAREAPLYGDVLDEILSHVPLIDLVPAAHVSRTWRLAVHSSLRHFARPEPWLVVRRQSRRPPLATTTHAYDPRSKTFLQITHPNPHPTSNLRASHSNLLYTLSPAKLSFSSDPLGSVWTHVSPPRVWRTDPIVALIGNRVVVAGGTWDFEDDPLSVEIYNLETRNWDACGPMPDILKDSAASTWLSVAANDSEMFVIEKSSGITYSFDPDTRIWTGPMNLRPDPLIYSSAISFSGENRKLLLLGITGDGFNPKSMKLWEVGIDEQSVAECKLVSEAPMNVVEKLKGTSGGVSSVVLTAASGFLYVVNPAEPEEVVLGEAVGREWRWRSVRNPAVDDGNRMERFVFGCATVGIGELERAVRLQGMSFRVVA